VSACALESFTVESSDFVVFPVAAVSTLVQHHGKTLRRFNALHITVEHDGVEAICKGCPHLEQMCIELGTEIVRSTHLASSLVFSLTVISITENSLQLTHSCFGEIEDASYTRRFFGH
jgi:hypothetical protein